MSTHYGDIPVGAAVPFLFDSFAAATGASITLTGLALADIKVYKDGGVAERASTAGYTLLDTDGIDFDGITGIHGFSINTGDNTTAGFWTAGSWYHVVINSVTVDGQAINFVAFSFRLVRAEGVTGVPSVNITHVIADPIGAGSTAVTNWGRTP